MRVLMAGHGDCLWIEYGDPEDPCRVLIDAGVHSTFQRLGPMLEAVRTDGAQSHQALILTHVDSDHIAGMLPILASPEHAAQFSEIWFNGRKHLEPVTTLDMLGGVQGELLTDHIVNRKLAWNKTFKNGAIVVEEDGPLPEIKLANGATVTLLSPGWPQLEKMADAWDDEIRKAGLKKGGAAEEPKNAPGLEMMGGQLPDIDALLTTPFIEDDRPANGSSIAMLFAYGGATMLLGADAHPGIFIDSIKRMAGGQKLKVDVFKLPHHGSRRNVTPELLALIEADMYVFSSNGAYHGHPDVDAVARVIHSAPEGATMVFNRRTKFNDMWDSATLKKKWKYETVYGEDDDGVDIVLL